MIKKSVYTTHGTCSRSIYLEIENGIIHNVRFNGGCNGNTQGVSKLVEGMRAETVVGLLKGIDCGGRGTSCPDQLATAIEKVMAEEKR
jgi:uncharacterized protein (TIGR03905 family)